MRALVVAYQLSLRHIDEMMQECGVFVDNATVHRWAVRMLPVLAAFSAQKTPDWYELANGRNLYQGGGPVEVSLPRR